MDPHSFIARAEAQRWLGIAEKLLMSHDLVGSKTFAIRARESDPRLEAADQILAIADTLLASEKRVVGNNGAHQPDYYAILQLVRFVQDAEHIASQYRRLAVMLNPHQNRFPYADQAFQLVNDAWTVLSNPMRKSMYDSDLDYPPQQQMNSIGFNLEQQHHQQQHHQQQQPHNFFSINHMGAGHEQELPEQQQTFQSRLHQSHQHQHQQLQQHNFLSQPNPVRPLPVREQEHMFQHREQEQLFQSQVQPFQVTSPPHQQTRPSPQPSQSQTHIHSPPATQPPFSWPQSTQLSQPQQLQHQQVKQEQQHQHQHQVNQEQQLKHGQQLQQQMKQEQLKQQQLKQEQLKQQQLQQEQLKQKQLQEEQRKQQLQQEQLKQQQLHQEQLKQQQLQEEQRKQQQLLEEQRKQQQLLEEQRKQQQLQDEQRKQQQLLEEQRQQQQLLEEQRKQQQLLEEQRKQQQLLEEQRKQQQLLEEQRKQQQLLEEQRKQQQLLEEQRKQQQLQEEQRKQQQLQEEQRKQQQLQEEQRKQQQLQEEQRKQQQLQQEQLKQQQEQLKQQQQESAKQNSATVQLPNQFNSNHGIREEETETEAETEAVDDSPTFWTACPYCFYMYEYPKVYVECTLRCDNCKRAYQAVRVSSPPPIIEGQDACFYCWGFFPLGLSMSHMQKNDNKGTNSNWTPFSSLHNASKNVQNHLNEQAAPKENLFVNKSSGPRIYIDDITDDVFFGVSEPSSNSDTEWVGTKKQKSKRMDKGFKERIQVLALRAMYAGNGSVKNLRHGISIQEGVEVPTVLVVETSKINVGSNTRKQSSQVAKELGKLDLNVEFDNNEGEEAAHRMNAGTRMHRSHGQGEVDSIEFFEGLDEYLSRLPILSVVNEEKVKVA